MSRKLVDNPGDPEQVQKAKQSKQEERRQELDDVKWLLASTNGRRIFWRLVRGSDYFMAWVGDEEKILWREGKKALVAMLFNDALDASPVELGKMLAEGTEKEKGK